MEGGFKSREQQEHEERSRQSKHLFDSPFKLNEHELVQHFLPGQPIEDHGIQLERPADANDQPMSFFVRRTPQGMHYDYEVEASQFIC